MPANNSYLHNLRLDRHWSDEGCVYRGWPRANGEFPPSESRPDYHRSYMWTLGVPKTFWIDISHPRRTGLPSFVDIYMPGSSKGFDKLTGYASISDGTTAGVVRELDGKIAKGDFPEAVKTLWNSVMAGFDDDLKNAEELLVNEYATLQDEEYAWLDTEDDYCHEEPMHIEEAVEAWRNFRLTDDLPVSTLEAYARMANAWDYYFAATGRGVGDPVVQSERRVDRLLDIIDSRLEAPGDWNLRARLLNCLRQTIHIVKDCGSDGIVKYIRNNEKWIASNVIYGKVAPDTHIVKLLFNLRRDWERLDARLTKEAKKIVKEYTAADKTDDFASLALRHESELYLKRAKTSKQKIESELDAAIEKEKERIYGMLADVNPDYPEEDLLRLSVETYECVNSMLGRISLSIFMKGLYEDDDEMKAIETELTKFRTRIETAIKKTEHYPSLFNLVAAASEISFLLIKHTTIADHSWALEAEDRWMEKASRESDLDWDWDWD